MEQFWVVFWGVVGTIATGLATWLTTMVVSWLNQKIKDKKLARWSSELFTIIMGAVQTVMQEFVSVMKKEGKFDEKAQAEAKDRAYKLFLKARIAILISEKVNIRTRTVIRDNEGHFIMIDIKTSREYNDLIHLQILNT